MSSDIKPQKGIQKVSRRCQETFSSESALSAGAEGCFFMFLWHNYTIERCIF